MPPAQHNPPSPRQEPARESRGESLIRGHSETFCDINRLEPGAAPARTAQIAATAIFNPEQNNTKN
jgi:hypothetical protein